MVFLKKKIERIGDLPAVEAQPALATFRGHMQQTARAVQQQQLREVEQRQQAEFAHDHRTRAHATPTWNV